MRKIDSLLTEYGSSHKNMTNKLIHWICVPLIFFSIVGMLWSIPSNALNDLFNSSSAYMNWGMVALVLILFYYIRLSPTLAIGMSLFSALCLFFSNKLSMVEVAPLWAICIAIFVLAWIGQFYGHHVEGKKPSFFKDLQFLLIGPAWLMHFIYKKLGIPY